MGGLFSALIEAIETVTVIFLLFAVPIKISVYIEKKYTIYKERKRKNEKSYKGISDRSCNT